MNWILMPVLNCLTYTRQAIADGLAQTGVDPRVLVINQGSDDETRHALEQLVEETDGRVLVWTHEPPLPSLSATWNTALDFVWQAGGTEALVVNNDVRLHAATYAHLTDVLRASTALFVSAVGVTERQFKEVTDGEYFAASLRHDDIQKGGPDFSCFLISKACHAKYRFDESYVPAYCEDLDMHRRMMLGGDGARIFSVNLPYLHYASRTVNSFTPAQQQAFAARVQQARAYYERKWGGPVNEERFFSPFDDGVTYSTAGMPNPPTTPALQAWVQQQGVTNATNRVPL